MYLMIFLFDFRKGKIFEFSSNHQSNFISPSLSPRDSTFDDRWWLWPIIDLSITFLSIENVIRSVMEMVRERERWFCFYFKLNLNDLLKRFNGSQSKESKDHRSKSSNFESIFFPSRFYALFGRFDGENHRCSSFNHRCPYPIHLIWICECSIIKQDCKNQSSFLIKNRISIKVFFFYRKKIETKKNWKK